MSEEQKPNLDLINMVQDARMQHDAQAKPSQISAVYWIEAKNQQSASPAPTSRAGYWRIPTDMADVDELWARIKEATEQGKLGYKSKVSTASADEQSPPDSRVIHVMTYDRLDRDDVERIRAALTALGVTAATTYQS
ncbi:MAG: DUF1917 domain-containing protein [Anaerolineae bacterium]|nr:DUF1917 domain-containing protein [Anaerolineae bacterium]